MGIGRGGVEQITTSVVSSLVVCGDPRRVGWCVAFVNALALFVMTTQGGKGGGREREST